MLFDVREKPGIKHPSQIKIGMVGRLHEHKDHEALIRAVALLPTQYQLHLAGDGQKREALESLAQQLDITNRVFFHGVVSDIPTFLEQMDLYVQSSLIEGFGLAAVEAMAAGLPVLSSNVPGLDDVIGNASYLFEVSNSEELANKIIQVCDSNENYSVASKYSILRCKEFTIEKFRDSYYKAYDGLFIQG